MAQRRIWPAWQYVVAFWFAVFALNRPYEKSANDFAQWCMTVLPLVIVASAILYVVKDRRNKRLRNQSNQGGHS